MNIIAVVIAFILVLFYLLLHSGVLLLDCSAMVALSLTALLMSGSRFA